MCATVWGDKWLVTMLFMSFSNVLEPRGYIGGFFCLFDATRHQSLAKRSLTMLLSPRVFISFQALPLRLYL